MREILFRAKDIEGNWCKGFYCAFNGKSHRIYTGYAETDCGDYYPDYTEVNPETVGQYTGLTDKNGTKIFEGDIVKHDFGKEQIGTQYALVKYSKKYTSFIIEPLNDWMYCDKSDCKVIGNIYDNPELLKG